MNLLAVSLASSELSALTAPALPASRTTPLLALSSASKAPRATRGHGEQTHERQKHAADGVLLLGDMYPWPPRGAMEKRVC